MTLWRDGRSEPRHALSARLIAVVALVVATLISPGARQSATAAVPANYLVGTGLYDITGDAAETGMFGYANGRDADGIQQRLWSHAYIIGSVESGKRVVFVSADMGAMFQSVKLEVVRRLQERYGQTYTDANVMLTATHTHVANAGQSHFPLYVLASADKSGMGYSQRNFEAAVDGIVRSITRAHDNLGPGSVELVRGDLPGAAKNRSLTAYRANKDAGQYEDSVDTSMTMLKLRKADGREIGMVNWFAVHATSLSQRFTKLSGDNKGYAQALFEKAKGTDPSLGETFVASFANANEGDAVPVEGNASSAPGFQGSSDELVNAQRSGSRQFAKAWQLYTDRGSYLDGTVDYRHRWADFENYTVSDRYTGQGDQRLCSASRGFSFAAGGENGPSNIPGIYEGMTAGSFSVTDAINQVDRSPLGALVRLAFGSITWGVQDPCQGQKPNLLTTGNLDWVPQVLPFQVFRIGSVAIIGAPVEPTTMAGRRIRATVLDDLRGTGVDTGVIAGLANSYSGYLTTREEYDTQQYEGASTEFGPHTLSAYQQEFGQLSAAIRTGSPVADDRAPADRRGELRAQRAGVVWDGKYAGETFGGVLVQAHEAYLRGETAAASFRGGHPKNDPMTMSSFLYVQRWDGSQWVNYRNDNDWDTTYEWQRDGGDRTIATVQWRIGPEVPAGTYRLVHQGYWKNGWTGKLSFYQGASRSFTVS